MAAQHYGLANPKRWGASGWYVLHHMSFKMNSVAEARDFYKSLIEILPCCTCRDNFRTHMSHLPFPNKRKDIPKWVYDVHQRVNGSIGGDELRNKAPSYKDIEELYIKTDRKKEAFFVKTIIQTHPGFRSEALSEEYMHALRAFLKILTGEDVAVQSRRQLSEWFKTRYAVRS
jgi:hypothetical protein